MVFEISAGNTEALFAIDLTGGQLRVNGPLDYETSRKHSLSLTIYDVYTSSSAKAGLSASVDVEVDIIDVNESPSLSVSFPTLFVTEGTGDTNALTALTLVGEPLVRNASDPDGDFLLFSLLGI